MQDQKNDKKGHSLAPLSLTLSLMQCASSFLGYACPAESDDLLLPLWFVSSPPSSSKNPSQLTHVLLVCYMYVQRRNQVFAH